MMGRDNSTKFKARLKAQIEEYGEAQVLHPTRLKGKIKQDSGRVLEESKDDFMEAVGAFIPHHTDFKCRNYNQKRYVTSCHCLKNIVFNQNKDTLVKQIKESLWNFFSRTKESQKIIFKE